jgi:glucan phosphoethanolaminetransferase (alkaline phosphatase superfamily)
VGVIAPIVILALACSVFLRYSVATYRMAVLDPLHEGDGEELLPLFRSSLVWLIAVWIVVLALKALLVLNVPLGG